ncbi:MAG: helix-turn-helix domain-containing protein [Deltaproteobacteria bacterium]|nr:helix-turn-helix domain-containing protein [Deltaproteobacteria bacterium]
MDEMNRIATGVSQLDRILGGLFVGDNVVWYDDAGSLAYAFCLNFMQASESQDKHIIYVSFDRSPKNLLDKLGALADYEKLTILDCFTYGKGEGSEIFLKFYREKMSEIKCRIVTSKEPKKVEKVMDAFYGIHADMTGDVRFVFESITGMQELWGGEESILTFYSHSCPRLYELNTIAYWIMEKEAHTPRLRASINQIAQVAIELSVKRGKTSLTVLKAEKRDSSTLNRPYGYWTRDMNILFDSEKRPTASIDMGIRLKELRVKRGLSQTEVARLIGVTPSTISQIESNLIYPSVPALLKMAEILNIEVSAFFQGGGEARPKNVFTSSDASDIRFGDLPEESISGKLLTPLDFEAKAEPYIIEIAPNKNFPGHFFSHKGDEIGYILSGELQMNLEKTSYIARAGDLIYLANDTPACWKNTGTDVARLLWIKIL